MQANSALRMFRRAVSVRASWSLALPRSCQLPSLLDRLPARLPLARVVISRGERNFGGATLPRIHPRRDHYRGVDFVGCAVNGDPEPERRRRGPEASRVAR